MPREELPSIEAVAASLSAKAGEVTAPPSPPDATPTTEPPTTTPIVAEAAADPAAPVTAPPAVDPAAPVVEKKDPAAARFAALSRREKEARQRDQQLQQREAEITARLEAADKRAKDTEAAAAAARSAKRPLEAMKALGYTMEQITMDALGNYKPAEPDPVDTKLGERLSPLEQQLAKANELLQQQAAQLAEIQQERSAIAQRQVRNDIAETAVKNGHEIIQAIGEEAYTMVTNVISHFWQQNKMVLSYDEACAKVEDYYTETLSAIVDKSPKIKQKYAVASAPPVAKPVTPAAKKEERTTTLTNSLNQGSGATKVNLDKLSKNDALAELAKSLKYT